MWGILGGALPGISPSITMALLLPFTYGMDPTVAIVMLASTYVGAEYGGSIPAILLRTPGTNAAAATVVDGYAMKQQGRAGEALGISLYSGCVGGLVGLAALVLLAEPLSRVALAFTPPAYFAVGVLGLSVIASLARASLLKGLIAGVIGLMIATVGTDPVTGLTRFTFDRPELLSGIPPLLVMVGLFAVSELLVQANEPGWDGRRRTAAHRVSRRGRRGSASPLPQLIGSVVGTFEGLVPGGGGSVSAFLSYNEAKRWSRHPEEFGHGSPEGVAAPEAANNTVACTALIPMLGLGIPGSNSAAVLLGGFLMHGLVPGPMLFVKDPTGGDGPLHRALRRQHCDARRPGTSSWRRACGWSADRSRTSWPSSTRSWCRASSPSRGASSTCSWSWHSASPATCCARPTCRCCRWCSVWCWASWSNPTTAEASCCRAVIT